MSEIDDYLAALPKDARATLEKLRAVIRQAAPQATEKISYQMPAFVHHGVLVSYAAFKDHCSFFPMSSSLLDRFEDDVATYRTSKGTLHFPIGKSLPAALVKKLVKARIEENEARTRRKDAKRDAKSTLPAKKPAQKAKKI
jgi:uncharacterized protein YdhG (YjbR/CyaY superfamily)